MVSMGIFLMVAAFIVAVARGMSGGNYGDAALSGMKAGQSAWFLLPFFGGIVVMVLGFVRKANATRDQQTRFEHDTMTTKVVPVEDAPGGGAFRGAFVEVDVPDPILAAAERDERVRLRARGTTYLIIGGSILALTILYMVSSMMGHSSSPRAQVEHILTAFGLGVFPFGLGLFFTIKGGLLRTK